MSPQRIIRVLPNIGRGPELLRCYREISNRPTLIGGYLGLRSPNYPCEFQARNGDRLTLETFEDLATAWLVFIRHEYVVDPSCRTILDAGANIGTFSLFAVRAAHSARIVALEPFPSTLARLSEHVQANGRGDRVVCRPWALGGADGVRHMNAAPIASQFRNIVKDDSPGSVPVEMVTLATVMEREGIEEVDLLKMDIEGSEYELIRTTPPEVLRRIRSIVLEYHPNGSKAELFSDLRSAGFEVVKDKPAPTPGYGIAECRLGSPAS